MHTRDFLSDEVSILACEAIITKSLFEQRNCLLCDVGVNQTDCADVVFADTSISGVEIGTSAVCRKVSTCRVNITLPGC